LGGWCLRAPAFEWVWVEFGDNPVWKYLGASYIQLVQNSKAHQPHRRYIMRQLQSQEVKSVSGAGLLTGVVTTGAQAGGALLGGFVKAGVIVGKPLVTGTINLFKFLI